MPGSRTRRKSTCAPICRARSANSPGFDHAIRNISVIDPCGLAACAIWRGRITRSCGASYLSARQHAYSRVFIRVLTPRPPHSCRGSTCGNRTIRQNSQPAVDLIPAEPGELFTLARILVVDDDAAVQLTVRLLLERAGHSVVTADDGRKGLALCQTEDFDLLFLDIFMPGMDGFETMRMVRQHRPQIPIIVISGRPVSTEEGAT